MSGAQQVYIVAADGEAELAERLAVPLRGAGYAVTHNGTVRVGDSIVEEATRSLARRAAVVLCATAKAVGTNWTHKIVNAAHAGPGRVFVVQMEEDVHTAALAVNTVVARYDQDAERAVADLLEALRAHFPPPAPPPPLPAAPAVSLASLTSLASFNAGAAGLPGHAPAPLQFLDHPSGVTAYDDEALRAFRGDLREEVRAGYPASLTAGEFLGRAGVSAGGVLTRTGALLFARYPGPQTARSMVKCVRYFGTDRSAARESLTLEGPLAEVIVGARAFVADRVRRGERPTADTARAEDAYDYPMIAVREIIANAVVHRDYARDDACVHVRLFEDRLEISSPGGWYGREVGTGPMDLGALEGQSTKRNFQLARLLSWTRLVEGEGSGIPTALADCADTGAGRPSVVEEGGFVTVTVRPLEAVAVRRGPAGPEFPLRIGVVPRQADRYQARALEQEVRDALAEGLDVFLTGLGGVGKTQLAAHQARELWAAGRLDLLLWVPAGDREAVVRGYAQAAAVLDPGLRERDPEAAANLLLARLARGDLNWLVVLDDVVDPSGLTGLWPPDTPCGSVLATARRHDASLSGELRRVLPVGSFAPLESRAYLTAKFASAGRVEQPEYLQGLAEQLSHVPLALAQAAAYMIDADLDIATYLDLLLQHRLDDVLPDSASLPDDQPATVSATVSLAIGQADRMRPAGVARPLLELASVLAASGIPVSLLLGPPALRYLTARTGREVDRLSAQLALRSLHRLGLVTLAADTVEVHRLVQRVSAEDLSPDAFDEAVRAAGDALTDAWPEIEADPAEAQALRANARALVGMGLALFALCEDPPHPVLLRLARSIGEAMPASAAAYLEPVCAVAAVELGPDHPRTLEFRAHRATCQADAGDVAGAATALSQIVADQTRVLGAAHPDTLTTAHSLAWALGQSGDAEGAVGILAAVLPDAVEALGPHHPDTLTIRSSLAFWRGETGDPAGAVAQYEEVLAARRFALGDEHPQVFATRSNLASALGQSGNLTEAVALSKDLLKDELRVLGPDHPSTLLTRNNLASWLGQSGDHATALRLQRQLLADQERVLGPDHPNTLTSRNNLATWTGMDGSSIDAARSLITLVADQNRVLGPHHREAVSTRKNLARWLGTALEEQKAAPRKAARITAGLDPELARRVRRRLSDPEVNAPPWQDLVDEAVARTAEDLLGELLDLAAEPAAQRGVHIGAVTNSAMAVGAHVSIAGGVANTGIISGD
ncbi:tetratricopeptide repeat protein [Streptomyces bambusae]|uniref:tetratricopeptide repeat protein n=1 Tax=Streptomyces bambusae TaxID=1550616 RepID=UPI001CA5DA12|nr:tetratricopeptide repeat protein [Streptomyces bambusae]